MSENKYRDYLTDDTFHRQYLKNEDEPVGSSLFNRLAAGAGMAAGLYMAYKKGKLKKPMQEFISQMGNFRRTKLAGTVQGIRNWGEADIWRDMQDMNFGDRMKAMVGHTSNLKSYVDESLQAHQERTLSLLNKPLTDDIPEFVQSLQQYKSIQKRMIDEKNQLPKGSTAWQEVDDKLKHTLQVMKTELNNTFNTTVDQQAAMMSRTGFRQSTIEDIFPYLDNDAQRVVNDFNKMYAQGLIDFNPMKKLADSNVLIREGAQTRSNKYGEFVSDTKAIADMRDAKDSMSDFMNTIAEDFTIPFIKINPIRMFYLNEFTRRSKKPVFTMLRSNTRQPSITGDNGYAGQDYLYANGKVFNMNEFDVATKTFKVEADNGYLLDATGKNAPITRLTRNMANITTANFQAPSKGTLRHYWYKTARFLDLGFQDEPMRNRADIGDPALPITGVLDSIWNGFKGFKGINPYDGVTRNDLDQAFGAEPDWLFMRSYKTLKDSHSLSEYFGQFVASRKNMKDVTTASFLPYGFFERLNATLNQMKLGLSTENLGSAGQIATNLVTKRILPVWGAVEGYKYANYAYEEMFGDEFEDQFADFYKGASIQMASVRDNTGATDMFKQLGEMTPGHEFLTELPIPILTTEGMTPVQIGDLLQLSSTEEEVKQWFEGGEEEVRKGRYWEFGNTPYTGAKVDYFQPNFYRRITSDWEYTDTLWGSKDEYWQNHILPTPGAPLAPLNHLVLDPYHWERKHYEDRPYPVTGGIAEFEAFPIIGPVLNDTVGQIFKPQIRMHVGEDETQSEGFALAEQYGIINKEIASPDTLMETVKSFVSGEPSSPSGELSLASGSATYSGNNFGGGITPVAYTTSSGNVQIMNKTGQISVSQINHAIKEAGVQKTGQVSKLRFEDGLTVPTETGDPSVQTAMYDMHYNMTELGGFYGWASTMVLPSGGDQYAPRLETSDRAFGMSRGFWDQDLGNLGFDANEIFRRFLPRDMHKNYVNEIDNNMPTWMPGPEYFTDFQHGDPYVKVKKGEMRLPGESYEVMYGIDSDKIDNLDIGASSIGYDKQKMIEGWLHTDEEELAFEQFYTDRGTDWHKQWESEMRSKGVTISDEEYVKDESSNIGGFYDVLARHDKGLEWLLENAAEFTYYESSIPGTGNSQEGFYNKINVSEMAQDKQAAMYEYLLSRSDKALIDPKTRTESNWKEQEMQFANVQQVNFYAGQMQTPINYLVHVNMDAKEGEKALKVFAFEYNPFLEDYSKEKVEEARTEVRQMLSDGVVGRGDLYDPVDKYRILADVAPYSQQFRFLKSQLSFHDLSEEERQEVQEINEQLSQRKDRVRTYDYRFQTADVNTQQVTVTRVIDNNTFMTAEHPDNPIRLAGVYVPTGEDDPVAQKAERMIRGVVREGAKISIQVNADEANLVNNDTYGTISANVVGMGVGSLNRALISQGLAKEKTDDYSPAAVHARFTDAQIKFGSMWESFAHMDTPYHTKLLQVRSPLEQYQRREVYGKDWQDWASPIKDFAEPWYQNIISQQPIAAIGLGTFMGAMFGANPLGRMLGGMFGAVATTLGLGYVGAFEATTGERWVPERRRQEWEMNEYIDALKYVKYRGLYEDAAELALEREGFDVKAYLKSHEERGEGRQNMIRSLEEAKRKIYAGNPAEIEEARRQAVKILGPGNYPDIMKAINAKIEELRNERRVDKVSPIAAQAIQYYQASESTMYGYDPGEPLQNILSALPKKDRQYLSKFIEAPEEEREQILQVVPDYMERVLKATWGMPVEEKPALESYFTDHQLPDANWAGWDPRANLDDIKIKLVKQQGMDESEFDIWPEDEKRAAKIRDDITPEFDYSERIATVKHRLRDILGGAGLRDVQVEVTGSTSPGVNMDMDVRKDRRQEIVRAMNENSYSLM